MVYELTVPSCIMGLRISLVLIFFPFLYLFFSSFHTSLSNISPATYKIESFYLVQKLVFRLKVTKSNEE